MNLQFKNLILIFRKEVEMICPKDKLLGSPMHMLVAVAGKIKKFKF